jgi:lipopolysaccharide transport system permease protein
MQAVQTTTEDNQDWTEVIRADSSTLTFNTKDIWRYRDLLLLMVRRDFVATYKQTILGPIWFFLQPVLTTITFSLVFGAMAGISTDGVPMVLFYLGGLTLWNYFSECLTKTATVLKDNADTFGKVYFPRIIMPLSIVVSGLMKLGIQLGLFIAVWVFYLLTANIIHPNIMLLLLPYLIVLMGALGFGFGMIITSLTTKYRDMVFLLTFGVQLLMYATPVIYPLDSIHNKFKGLIMANPMTSIIETFKYGFLGSGTMSWGMLAYSTAFAIVLLIVGLIVFNKAEKSFTDTV